MASSPLDSAPSVDGIPTVDCDDLQKMRGQVRIIDVRRDDEFNGELGHIENAEHHALGPDLERFLHAAPRDASYVFVCRVGGRSAQATAFAMAVGLLNVANLGGGMMQWCSYKLPTVKK